MAIADRIKELRKKNGISQEELADKIGVSRQAVSKWESEQSTPDLDKIIMLSDYFEVTTDYILKGIKESKKSTKEINANIFLILATAFNFIGIIIASVLWYKRGSITAVIVGVVILIIGCAIFRIGTLYSSHDTIARAKHNFLSKNIWVISIIPISLIYNLIVCREPFPFPIAKYTIGMKISFLAIYCVFCGSISVYSLKKYRKSKV